MHVLLTGASGFVGGHLAKALVKQGHRVSALVRRSSKVESLQSLGLHLIYGDLATGEGLSQAVQSLETLDVVHHVAGVTKAFSENDFFQGNAEGTRRLLEAVAQRARVPRFVYCSSLAAIGPGTGSEPRHESHAPSPVSAYGRSKLSGESVVREFSEQVPSVIVRPPFVYGPGDTVNLPPLMLQSRMGLFLKPGKAERYLSFIHVEDLVQALIKAAEHQSRVGTQGHEGVYFAADPNTYTWGQFFSALSKALGKGPPREIILPEVVGLWAGSAAQMAGKFLGQAPIFNRDKAREMLCEAWTCSPQKAANDLAFKPNFAPLSEGLRHTVAWYRSQGML